MGSFLLFSILIVFSIPLLIINWLCLALDYIFYPSFRKTDVRPPVFIIGMFRTATTLCQNLLRNDTQHFTYMKFWELIFAPSVIQKKFVNQIRWLDRKMNGAIYRIVSRIDRFLFKSLENHHPMSFLSMEEDHFMFINTLTAPALWIMAPGVFKQYTVLQRYDHEMPLHTRKIDMFYYKTCIKRHMYVYGKGRRYLSKCPPNTIRIRTLQATFPGCRFVYMLRDPLYTLASGIIIFIQFRKMFLMKTDMQFIKPIILEMTDLFHRYPLIDCRELVGKSIFVVTFNEITGDSYHAIHRLYDHLGLEITDEFEQFLMNSTGLVSRHKTKNRYEPEQYGLSPERVREEYAWIYRDYPGLKG